MNRTSGSFPRARRCRRLSFASLLILLLAIAGLLAGCGSQGSTSSGPAATELPSSPDASNAPAAAPTTAPAAAAPSSAASASGAPGQTGGTTTNLPPLERMVIRNATLTLQVKDVETALQKIRDVADAGGGYVSTSHTSFVKDGDQDRMVGDVTIEVRSDVYDRSIESIRQLAVKVESEDGTSQDVTQEYVDLDANLRNLQASEDSLLKLTQQATNLNDILTLERELANVRGQIERIQGRQQFLQHNTDMATIAVSLKLPPLAVPVPPPEIRPAWNPLATFERGWQASLVALETLADALISIVSFGWWMIPLVIGAYLWLRHNPRGGAGTVA